ncbi:MAG TPA: nucleotidyltransferase [Chitinophagaceae bacterium]|nr:nucleotidyltransferase [Chitinophagaceae bacterium]
MDILDEDLIHFWTILNKYSVQYIMVGGFAVNLYGYTRATTDIDLLLKDDLLNRQSLAKAFSELGYGDISFEQLQFVPGWTNFYIGTGVQLDIMTSLKGVDISFDECLHMAPVAEIDGVMVPFLHINHLIDNKKSVNRLKDQIDVIELEKIKRILAEPEA